MIDIDKNSSLKQLLIYFKLDCNMTMNKIYKYYRSDFLSFIKKFTSDNTLIIDCYQDSIIALYENLVNDKIQATDINIKTYLFAIGKNQILNAINKNNKKLEVSMPEDYNKNLNISLQSKKELKNNENLNIAFKKLGHKCQEILVHFYYYKYSINAIMQQLEYKNENTVKAHKSRCIAKLRSIILNMKDNN